ncbi:hypothetical protein ACFXGR_28570 [Streptomyces mirabilis]|uniref:hypothetical protein n=1 Tax=Streptomyces mirabilis TaxID=68239 RepID=UPI003699D94E
MHDAGDQVKEVNTTPVSKEAQLYEPDSNQEAPLARTTYADEKTLNCATAKSILVKPN